MSDENSSPDGGIVKIEFEGMRELRRSLKGIGKEAQKQLRLLQNDAAMIVVADAKPRVPLGPGDKGHARDSIKAQSTQSATRITAGGNKYPYYPWLDFGGKVGPNRSVSRPFLSDGRYIWHSYATKRTEVLAELEKGLSQLIKDVGLEES